MNMLNYLRGKVTKIQADSPTKKTKNLSSSQEIYLEQINNYIEAEGGYDILKQKLFKAINQFYMHDSPFIQEIVILLKRGLVSNKRQWQLRSIVIIEDLLTNCSAIMNQAFNNRKFCQALQVSAIFLINLKAFDRKQIRQRIAGIFLYWHIKFQTQPQYIYHQFYEALKRCDIQFPSVPFIKQVVNFTKPSKLESKTDNNPQGVDQIIKDCQQTFIQADKLFKQNSLKIDTNYVRMLKAKNKKIYEISTSKQSLTSQQKQKLGQIYKKLRTLLKQIDKKNQQLTKQKALQKQKKFLQQKLQGMTPKKSQKQIQGPPIMSQKVIKKISSEHTKPPTNKKEQNKELNLLDEGPIQIKKKQSQPQQFVFSKDLLDIQVVQTKVQSPKKEQKKQQKLQKIQQFIQPQIQTPQKKQKKPQYDQLLDGNFASPGGASIDSEKKLNFKQLYAVNQLSPQLKDLDLLTPQKLKSKQSIKSQEQAQFGDYN